ncbi:hypothetical protein ScPMuIL_012899 [Solemya velum]
MALSRGVSGVFIVAARRTPFGTYGGTLKNVTATELGLVTAKAVIQDANISPEIISSIVYGNVIQASADAIYIARHIGLKVGVPQAVPGLVVNRLCGSGFQAIVSGAREIMLGEADVALVGGAENMSMAPYAVRNIRFGTRLGQDIKFEDTLWEGLTDSLVKMPMGITAENLAAKYNITREECENYALETQQRWKRAHEEGRFKAEIAPVTVKGKKGPESFKVDEHPRLVSLEAMKTLPTVFKKNGTVTAATASGVNDGAGSLIIASEEALKKYNMKPLARLVSYGISGCDPSIMGIGPVPASKAALKAAGKEVKDMDIVEVNEAFAPQFLAVQRELGLDLEKTNINGSGIAIGHPLGATGARITATLTHELQRQQKTLALGSACIGGGMGISVVLERV